MPAIYGRTHHMLVSCWGKRWKEVQLVMSALFTNYIDDSGTAPDQRVAIAAGLIVPAARIIALEREWDALKAKEGFTDFHASVFSAWFKNQKSEFANWDASKHDRVLRRVRQITKKYGVKTFTIAVKKDDYDEVVPAELKHRWGQNHYAWAIRQFVAYVNDWQRHVGTGPLEYIFDYMKPNDPCRKEIENVMDQAEDMTGNTGHFEAVSFRSRKTIPGLQCADLLAWTSFQVAQEAFFKKPMVHDAEVAWKDFTRYLGGEWRTAGAMMRPALQEAVRIELASGKSLDRFKAWEARKSVAAKSV
jgi:hypothetical protein